MTALAKEKCPPQSDVVKVINPLGKGGFLLVCEHASNFIPAEYENLGLNDEALRSHAAWDPGALGVAEEMVARLDAPLVAQRISRLVYDCNRPPESGSAMPAKSEIYDIPGNTNLTQAQRQSRIDQYYLPFHRTVAAQIDRHISEVEPPVIITIHSFTPNWHGENRDFDIGILHDKDTRFADEILASLKSETRFVVCRNAPYGPADGVTHTLVHHALPRGLMNIMFEIRNDIIATPDRQAEIGAFLSHHVTETLNRLRVNSGSSHL